MPTYLPLCIAFFSLLSVKSFAFGNQGHQLICQLAYQQLPKQQRLKVDAITKQIPYSHKVRINKQLRRNKNHSVTFAESCVWPDTIRSIDTFKKFSSWHYVNLPRDLLKIKQQPCKKSCITSALLHHYNEFKQAKAQQRPAWQSLLFTSHWLADIHQPLHVSFKSDRGGNRSTIKFQKSIKGLNCKNLHSLWDRCLLFYSEEHMFKVTNQHFTFSRTDSLSADNILVWANESLAISRSKSVLYCQLNNHSDFCAPYTHPIDIDEHYLLTQSNVLQQRAFQAAKRLNLFLTEI